MPMAGHKELRLWLRDFRVFRVLGFRVFRVFGVLGLRF